MKNEKEAFFLAQILFYIGISCMGLAAALGVILFFVLRGMGEKLKNKLDEEYGEPL